MRLCGRLREQPRAVWPPRHGRAWIPAQAPVWRGQILGGAWCLRIGSGGDSEQVTKVMGEEGSETGDRAQARSHRFVSYTITVTASTCAARCIRHFPRSLSVALPPGWAWMAERRA